MKIAQNFSTAYGGLAEHSKPALSAFSKRYNRNVQVCDDPRKGEPLIFTPSVPFLTCILTCIYKKTFPETEAITAHIPLGTHFPSQTKIPEKPGAKPLFGDFTLELLIRFERTTCSLRAIKGLLMCCVVLFHCQINCVMQLFCCPMLYRAISLITSIFRGCCGFCCGQVVGF